MRSPFCANQYENAAPTLLVSEIEGAPGFEPRPPYSTVRRSVTKLYTHLLYIATRAIYYNLLLRPGPLSPESREGRPVDRARELRRVNEQSYSQTKHPHCPRPVTRTREGPKLTSHARHQVEPTSAAIVAHSCQSSNVDSLPRDSESIRPHGQHYQCARF